MEESKNHGVVLVRVGSDTRTSFRRVYKVPDGVYLAKGENVFVKHDGYDCPGICMTDTVYLLDEEYDLLCKALMEPVFSTVSARISITRFKDTEGS